MHASRRRQLARWPWAMALQCLGTAAMAQSTGVGGSLALTSDYVYRGATLSQHEPALQGDIHYYSPRRWLAGLWATTARPDPYDGTGVELDPYLGYTQQLGADWQARVTGVYHAYSGLASAADYDYSELLATMAWRSRLFITAAVSADTPWQDPYGRAVRRSASAVDLAWHGALNPVIAANAGIGYYRTRRADSSGYAYGSAGLGYTSGRLHMDLSLILVSGAAHGFFQDGEASNHLVGTVLYSF